MTLTRSAPMRRTPLQTAHFAAKPIRCAHCRQKFTPTRAGQRVHLDCAVPWTLAETARKREAAKKADRKETREKLAQFKTIAQLIAKAQIPFNAFIRARDREKGCFVCGRAFTDAPGRVQHAGHVRSRGAAGHLRFNELNCHGECEGCNGPRGAKPHEIKAGAIARIGLEAYEALEADNTPHKWSREELIGIEKTYRAKWRALEKEMA